jgi:hypothetical protein
VRPFKSEPPAVLQTADQQTKGTNQKQKWKNQDYPQTGQSNCCYVNYMSQMPMLITLVNCQTGGEKIRIMGEKSEL